MYLLNDKDFKPKRARDKNNIVHWWLENIKTKEILDVTSEQYYLIGENPPYKDGKFGGFLTKLPSKRTKALINKLPHSQVEYYSSSLKFCKLAEGIAHLYPRLQSISKWDIAAGDAILRSAGGILLNKEGNKFKYNSKSSRTGSFFAVSSKNIWIKYIKTKF